MTQLLVYLVDGQVPSLPLARSPRTYKKPHWLPVAFNASLNAQEVSAKKKGRRQAQKMGG